MVRRVLILACLALATAAPAVAQPRGGSLGGNWGQQQDDARRGVQQGNLSLGQVIDIVRRHTPGQLLDAGLEAGPGGQAVYRVRWAAADGRRIDYLVDARSGAILSGG